MDRNFYYQKMAQQREREISAMWAHPRESGHEPFSRKQTQKLVFRMAFAMIVLSLVALSVL